MCIYCAYRSSEVPFGRLHIDLDEIFGMMGSQAYEPDDEMRSQVEKTLETVSSFCRPRYGYSVFHKDSMTEDSVSLAGCTFHTGRTIANILRDADRYALMVATSGVEFEKWYRDELNSGDLLREFLTSNIGSGIAEAAGRIALEAIEAEYAKAGLHTGNSYAPGYCGWPVSDQQVLFSLLPPLPCGIHLNASSLMTPIKSVSGIIPIGKNVSKQAYGCSICDHTDCYKTRK